MLKALNTVLRFSNKMNFFRYGGPQSKLIKNDYEIDYSTYLVTNRNVIVALVDPRGADRKELEMMYAVYRKIGTVEVEDQISVTR